MAQRARQVNKAFTLVELIIVLAIIAILAAVAIPRFFDIRDQAYIAQRDSIVGGVRAGIMLVAAKNQSATNPVVATFPPDLEATWDGTTVPAPGGQPAAFPSACGTATTAPCFELVLTQPITDGTLTAGWQQTGSVAYTFTDPITGGTGTKSYTYTSGTGRFD